MLNRHVREVPRCAIVKVECQPMLLTPVQVRDLVLKVELPYIAELCRKANRFISSTEIVLVYADAIVDPVKVVIVVVPPFVKVTVGEFEDRHRKDVPPFRNFHEDVNVVAAHFKYPDRDRVEESKIVELVFVPLQYTLQPV